MHGINTRKGHQAGDYGEEVPVQPRVPLSAQPSTSARQTGLVLRKYRSVIFVNGCFWHGHENCKYYVLPKSNAEFWRSKIERNHARDIEEQRKLAQMGWHCITVWECQLKPAVREKTLESLAFTLNSIFLKDHSVKRYTLPEEEHAMAAEPYFSNE